MSIGANKSTSIEIDTGTQVRLFSRVFIRLKKITSRTDMRVNQALVTLTDDLNIVLTNERLTERRTSCQSLGAVSRARPDSIDVVDVGRY
jgi:hypothetical protein